MSKLAELFVILVALPLVLALAIHLFLDRRRKQHFRQRKLRHGIKAARWKVLTNILAARRIRRLTYRPEDEGRDS